MTYTQFSRGDLAREYAARNGWVLLRRNIMVEGDGDVRYFELAAKLYAEANNGQSLLGKDLSIFSAGTGNNGGTLGIIDKLPSLLDVIESDKDEQGTKLFRVIVLADNDRAGNACVQALLNRRRTWEIYRDVFLVHRILPTTNRFPHVLRNDVQEANDAWKSLDCEIEDLLDDNIIDAFISTNPHALSQKGISCEGGARHCEWTLQGKANLIRYVERYAMLRDIERIVRFLQALRFHLGLTMEGC
ncbi:hypothetical protein J2777_002401 [Paraburkholderia graminis]|uniref:hypothetical protein n=1 Tax=Paraburkholderia graminis TaxID=60548 RepID=UPI00285787DE|nr:hypothetical protein [Paraburkholderia graminis]MDR6468673.1 hypothetical protein [Paraburkholderia graminis]